jgi:cytochrome c-type biogenesis protein CcmF
MYFIAYAMQLLTLICALGGSALALLQLWQQRGDALALIEKVHWAITGALSLAAALLLHALFWNDFSLVYVASYTDRVLPAFYRLTAFWRDLPVWARPCPSPAPDKEAGRTALQAQDSPV